MTELFAAQCFAQGTLEILAPFDMLESLEFRHGT